MDYRVDWLSLDQIDTTNAFYRITTTQDKPSIVESVNRVGLICPIIVKKTSDNYAIISGFRRVESCQQINWRNIPCRILSDNADETQCAELAIADNLTQRPLNLVEQARCLQLLTATTGGLDGAKEIATALGLSLNKGLVSKLQSVMASPEFIRNGLIAGKLSLPVMQLMSDLSKEDAEAVASLFDRLSMGLNKQREVLINLKEIAARDDVAVKCLLEEEGVGCILDDDRLDGNQKSREIRFYLKKRRYPRIVKTEEAFHDCVRKLGLGGAILISPPPGFEGCTRTMTIRIDSLDDLVRAHRKLSETIENPLVSDLFDCV
jgi:ParB family chromosome partitioning protein